MVQTLHVHRSRVATFAKFQCIEIPYKISVINTTCDKLLLNEALKKKRDNMYRSYCGEVVPF